VNYPPGPRAENQTDAAGESRRCDVVFGLLLAAIVALCAWLLVLMRTVGPKAVSRACRQQQMAIPLPGRPGAIFARSGRRYVPLAISRQVPSCYADPFLLKDSQLAEVPIAVGEALGIDPRRVQSELLRCRKKRFAWIERQIGPSQAQAISRLGLRAVRIAYEWRREYPNDDLAATVIGFRRIDGVAGAGLELTQNRYLAAKDGRRVVVADAARRAIWPLPAASRLPVDGANVFLTLDAVVQSYLQEAVSASVAKFSAEWGTGVVVDPQTGRVLAMCSVPSFDPNDYGAADPANITNRAVSVPFEPGSVFKPIIAAGAVEADVVDYQTRVFCENGIYHAHRGGRITDHGKSYGDLSVADGVIYSSNICMAKIGEKLGNETLYRIARRFGFGRPTGIELGGESGGIVRPLKKWDTYSLRRVPFGQEISVTAIQLAMAFSSLANGGLLLRPQLVDHVADLDGNVLYWCEPKVVRRVLSPEVAAQTLAVLRDVVEVGTGRACRMARWSSFGKTGTAQVAGVGGYVEGAYVSSFAGGAPVTNPRLMCLISIYRPDAARGYYGATVAAPYVKQVLRRTLEYLDVPPDKPAETHAAVKTIALHWR